MVKADALSRKTGNAKEGVESQFFPDGTLVVDPLNSLPHYPESEIRLMQVLAVEQTKS